MEVHVFQITGKNLSFLANIRILLLYARAQALCKEVSIRRRARESIVWRLFVSNDCYQGIGTNHPRKFLP